VEESLSNLKVAVELYIKEMGMPQEITSNEMIIVNFEVENDKTAEVIMQRSH
jgi:hypothetical protein